MITPEKVKAAAVAVAHELNVPVDSVQHISVMLIEDTDQDAYLTAKGNTPDTFHLDWPRPGRTFRVASGRCDTTVHGPVTKAERIAALKAQLKELDDALPTA